MVVANLAREFRKWRTKSTRRSETAAEPQSADSWPRRRAGFHAAIGESRAMIRTPDNTNLLDSELDMAEICLRWPDRKLAASLFPQPKPRASPPVTDSCVSPASRCPNHRFCIMPLTTPSIIRITHNTTNPSPTPTEIQHHNFAFRDAACAPARSPACNLLFTCAANTMAGIPNGIQQKRVARIANTR